MQHRIVMWRHTTGIVALFILLVAVFGIAIVAGSAVVAVGALLTGFVVTFVMAIAWMRPASYPAEHHPKIDRIFDDTAPH
jgi:hypothetical protein